MKQLEVQIMGQSYLLGCPDGGEAKLHQAVQRVDVAMCKIRDGGKVRARDRIAVLAALNLAFDVANLSNAQSEFNPDHSASENLTIDRVNHEAVLVPLIARLDKLLANDGRLF
jgi:cell division protein ZapA